MAEFLRERQIPARLGLAARAPRARRGSRPRRRRRARGRCARPARTPWASAASVPARRSRGARPVSAPMKSLREIAISSGARARAGAPPRRAAGSSAPASWRSPGPGSRISCSRATPRESASAHALAQEREHLAGDVVVEIGVLQALARRGARVHHHQRGAASRAHTSASAGSRRPLTSLTILAPAAIAARATAGL